MKEHLNDYEKNMLKMMEDAAREMDETIGRIGDEADSDFEAGDLDIPDTLDEKVFGNIEDYQKRVRERETAKAEGADEPMQVIESAENEASLSEEDQEALRLGRELQERRRKEEARKALHRKWAPWKRLTAAVIAIVMIGCVGVQSQGGAAKIVEKITRSHDYKEENRVVSSKDKVKEDVGKEEEDIYEQIGEELGIDPVRIIRSDNQINYMGGEIDTELRTVFLLYEYEGQTMSYIINCTYTEDVWGMIVEEEKVDAYVYEENVIPIQVEQYVVEESQEDEWVATFEYQGMYYSLIGRMKQEKFENILKNLIFP